MTNRNALSYKFGEKIDDYRNSIKDYYWTKDKSCQLIDNLLSTPEGRTTLAQEMLQPITIKLEQESKIEQQIKKGEMPGEELECAGCDNVDDSPLSVIQCSDCGQFYNLCSHCVEEDQCPVCDFIEKRKAKNLAPMTSDYVEKIYGRNSQKSFA